MNNKLFDVIVIGSGPSGIHATIPLIEKGLTVGLIDGGQVETENFSSLFTDDFETTREKRDDQYKLFLGHDFSGLISQSHAESMTTGSKYYISGKTEENLPLESNIPIIQSLAQGGLGQIWGGVCDFFSNTELTLVGLPTTEMHQEIKEIISHIGVSGEKKGYGLQPPLHLDIHGEIIKKIFQKKRVTFNKLGIEGYQPCLSLLSQKKGSRQATRYKDMDFWNNINGSMYRPKDEIFNLKKNKNFTYFPNFVVLSFKEKQNGVTIQCINILTKEKAYFTAKKLILAAGALNSVRILLQSKKLYNIRIPFLTKSHVLIPGIHLPTLNKRSESRQISLCQFILSCTDPSGISQAYAQLYSYKSLLLYKLLQYVPLSKPEAFTILHLLISSFVITDVRFPTQISEGKYCMLEKKGNIDVLKVYFEEIPEELAFKNKYSKKIKKALRELSIYPIKTIQSFTTAHYAGGVSSIPNKAAPFSSNKNGQVMQYKHVFVADSATWNSLPAKPPTLTIMANARRIGKHVASFF